MPVPPWFTNGACLRRPDLYDAQGGKCYLCGGILTDLSVPHPRAATLDHVRPRGRGYTRLRNAMLAHYGCNHLKASRWPHPCELLYVEAVNLMIDWEEWRDAVEP